jgi:hypothetical protein
MGAISDRSVVVICVAALAIAGLALVANPLLDEDEGATVPAIQVTPQAEKPKKGKDAKKRKRREQGERRGFRPPPPSDPAPAPLPPAPADDDDDGEHDDFDND